MGANIRKIYYKSKKKKEKTKFHILEVRHDYQIILVVFWVFADIMAHCADRMAVDGALALRLHKSG